MWGSEVTIHPHPVGSEPLPTGPSHPSQRYHFNTCIRLETACEWGLSLPHQQKRSLHLNGMPNHTPSPARVWPCLDTKQLLPGTTGPPAWVRKWKLPHLLFGLLSKFCSRSFLSVWVALWPPLQHLPVDIRWGGMCMLSQNLLRRPLWMPLVGGDNAVIIVPAGNLVTH